MACLDCGKQISPASFRCRTCSNRKMMKEPGRAIKTARGRWPEIPDGFALVAPHHTVKELRIRYGKSHETIKRWLRVKDVKARPASMTIKPSGPMPAPDRLQWDDSPVGEAMRYLSKYGPVSRCTSDGKKHGKLDHWRRGNAILTDKELIERADWLRSRERQAA